MEPTSISTRGRGGAAGIGAAPEGIIIAFRPSTTSAQLPKVAASMLALLSTALVALPLTNSGDQLPSAGSVEASAAVPGSPPPSVEKVRFGLAGGLRNSTTTPPGKFWPPPNLVALLTRA